MDSTELTSANTHSIGRSPFDAMKRADSSGAELWSARDLQVATAYARWEDFAAIGDDDLSEADAYLARLEGCGR